MLNECCVRKAVVAGLVLGCKINDESRFERKHYFYPDNPAGYQITQNDWPIASSGRLHYGVGKSTMVERIQLETDTGKSKKVLANDPIAVAASSSATAAAAAAATAAPTATVNTEESDDGGRATETVVELDFNRAGSPLIEIVFAPDIRAVEDAGEAVLSVRNLLRHANVCDGRFELGNVRCDLNVSAMPAPSSESEGDLPDYRVEVKVSILFLTSPCARVLLLAPRRLTRPGCALDFFF